MVNLKYPYSSVAPLSSNEIAKLSSFCKITWSCDLGLLNLNSIVSGINPSACCFPLCLNVLF